MKNVYFLGQFTALNRNEAAELVRSRQDKIVNELSDEVQTVVVGEKLLFSDDWNLWNDQLDTATKNAFESGTLEIITETVFLQRYGMNVAEESFDKLFTSAMLAKMLQLPSAFIRQLERKRLIFPVRQVFRLMYYDSQTVLLLKQAQRMLRSGLSFYLTAERLKKIQRFQPVCCNDITFDGKNVLIAMPDGVIEHTGQRRIDFQGDSEETPQKDFHFLDAAFCISSGNPGRTPIEEYCERAELCEMEGGWKEAAELYRTALAAGGTDAVLHFRLAEALYQLGDLTAARERYSVALERDENFVEARANLGRVLMELGESELAAAAFRGVLQQHPDYEEVRKMLEQIVLHE